MWCQMRYQVRGRQKVLLPPDHETSGGQVFAGGGTLRHLRALHPPGRRHHLHTIAKEFKLEIVYPRFDRPKNCSVDVFVTFIIFNVIFSVVATTSLLLFKICLLKSFQIDLTLAYRWPITDLAIFVSRRDLVLSIARDLNLPTCDF